MDEIDNPFDGEADRIVRETGTSVQDARDVVVAKYLCLGDTRSLAHWLWGGEYAPGFKVRRLLSLMLQPDREDSEDPSKTYTAKLDLIPYELVAHRRDGKRGPRNDPVVAERNTALLETYGELFDELGDGASDSAVMQLTEQLGPEITESMIREAIKSRSPKSTKGR